MSFVLQGLHWVRAGRPILCGLDLNLSERRIGIIGDNGAGKTSLLRLLAGLDEPSQGQVLWAEQDRSGPAADCVGLMFQNPDDQIIFATVQEEIALSFQGRPDAQGRLRSRRQSQAQAQQWLQAQGLQEWGPRPVSTLSHGQRQRLCWWATLAAQPRSILLDEPFASTDAPTQRQMRASIDEASQQIIVASHVLEPLWSYDRVLWMESGRIRMDGAPRAVCEAYLQDVAQRDLTHLRWDPHWIPAPHPR